MGIAAGELRHRVTLERPITVTDEYGTTGEPVWEPVLDVWAGIKTQTSRETAEARQVDLQTTYKVTLRYRCDVGPDWRIRWGDKVLNIGSLANLDGRNRELQIIAHERGNA